MFFTDSKGAIRQQGPKELFNKLPKDKQDELYALWLEYEKQECFEAQIVKALDKLESMLFVLEHRQGHMFPKHLIFPEPPAVPVLMLR